MTQPKLGHRAIDAYNRLCKEVAAYNYVLRIAKPKEPVSSETLLALNGMIILANRLFRRHADLPRFLPIDPFTPMHQVDFAILITRLTAACLRFEEINRVGNSRDLDGQYAAVAKDSHRG